MVVSFLNQIQDGSSSMKHLCGSRSLLYCVSDGDVRRLSGDDILLGEMQSRCARGTRTRESRERTLRSTRRTATDRDHLGYSEEGRECRVGLCRPTSSGDK